MTYFDPPRGLSEDERALLTHVSLWGATGYPVRKLGRGGWIWEFRGIKGPPTVFKTKAAAVASFEAFYDVLIRAHADESYLRAVEARDDRNRLET